MGNSKHHSRKQQNRTVDFKKIRRKIGRKLPPPQNATNTEIKFKAIILPEQSIASEKNGLAVSKKGLTLKELLQQASHYNAKVRRGALHGIKDLFMKYPSELKLHKCAVIEKLRELISDVDTVVRETLYHLFKSVVFPACKEDNQEHFIPLITIYIFNAMTHLSIDIRMMSFKFLDLVVEHYPPCFFLYAEKILQNYVNILRNHQFYVQDASKLRNIIAGVVHCLLLLPSNGSYNDGDIGPSFGKDVILEPSLHDFQAVLPKSSFGFPFVDNLRELMHVLLNGFHEFISFVCASQALDAQSFDCMFSILQSIDLLARYFLCYANEKCQSESEVFTSPKELQGICIDTTSLLLLRKLWDIFPVTPTHMSDTGESRYFTLNVVITKIFLQLKAWIVPSMDLSEKFLTFLEASIAGKNYEVEKPWKKLFEKHIISFVSFLPKLVHEVEDNWRYRLLQVFTEAFKFCEPDSHLKLICLTTIKAMLLPHQGSLSIRFDVPEISIHIVSWIREIPALLMHLGDKHPLHTKMALLLQLRIGQCVKSCNSTLAQEYDAMQHSLCEFYCSSSADGSLCYGPFMKLPRDSQELSICSIYYHSCLDPRFYNALAYCCLCHGLDAYILLRTIEVLHLSFNEGHIGVAEHISFFVTLLMRFKVDPEMNVPVVKDDAKISKHAIFKKITRVICSMLPKMGDNSFMLQIIGKLITDNMSDTTPIPNMCAMLRVLVTLDGPLKIPEENIVTFRECLHGYLMGIAHCFPEDSDEPLDSDHCRRRQYLLLPCSLLFLRQHELLGLVLGTMSCIVSRTDECRIINAVIWILIWMLKDVKLQKVLSMWRTRIDSILQNIFQSFEGSNVEERHKLQCSSDRLKMVASAANL